MLSKIWSWLFPRPVKVDRMAMRVERQALHNRLDRAIVNADRTLDRLREIEAHPPVRLVKLK